MSFKVHLLSCHCVFSWCKTAVLESFYVLCVWIKETIVCLDVTVSSRCGFSHLCLCFKSVFQPTVCMLQGYLDRFSFVKSEGILKWSADFFLHSNSWQLCLAVKSGSSHISLEMLRGQHFVKLVLGLPVYKDRKESQTRWKAQMNLTHAVIPLVLIGICLGRGACLWHRVWNEHPPTCQMWVRLSNH